MRYRSRALRAEVGDEVVILVKLGEKYFVMEMGQWRCQESYVVEAQVNVIGGLHS